VTRSERNSNSHLPRGISSDRRISARRRLARGDLSRRPLSRDSFVQRSDATSLPGSDPRKAFLFSGPSIEGGRYCPERKRREEGRCVPGRAAASVTGARAFRCGFEAGMQIVLRLEG